MKNRLLQRFVLITLIGMAGPLPAMPPHPDLQLRIDNGEARRPGGLASLDGTKDSRFNKAPLTLAGGATPRPFAVLCLLIDFPDNVARIEPALADSLVFADGFGTVRDYYQDISYGAIDLTTYDYPSDVGWERLAQPYSSYVDGAYGIDSPYPHNTQKLCEEAVAAADANIDFSRYDNDGDGYVDVVIIVHAGPGAEFTGNPDNIWSHKWEISPVLKDGVYIRDYVVLPEYWIRPGDLTIGVFCHELGHVFGLTDLYDTDNSSYGTGAYSLMSIGCWNGIMGDHPSHPDAWSRSLLGWARIDTVRSAISNITIPPAEQESAVYRLWTNGRIEPEYFLVENRQRIGYDAGLPGSGLCIWHIDERATHNNYEWYPARTIFGHYLVALEQADNRYDLEKKSSAGDAGDFFPGSASVNDFSPLTTPGSASYSGTNTLVTVSNISDDGQNIMADFIVSLGAQNAGETDDDPIVPALYLGQNYPNPFNPLTAIRYSLPQEGNVRLSVFNILGQKIIILVDEYQAAGEYEITWNGQLSDGANAPSGLYLYELEAGKETAVRKMLLVK